MIEQNFSFFYKRDNLILISYFNFDPIFYFVKVTSENNFYLFKKKFIYKER